MNGSNSTSITQYADDSRIGDFFAGAILLIICIGAIIGNTCMWIIIIRNKSLQNVTNSFILGLTTADLFVAVVNMPITVVTLFYGAWPLSETVCLFFGYTNMLTLVTSVMSLCNISINRYVMVCKPLKFKRIYTKKRAGLMMLGCIGFSAFVSLPPLFGWAEYTYIELQSFCFCDWRQSLSYALFMIGTCFGIPFSVMSVCNAMIFRTVRASKRRVAAGNKISENGAEKIRSVSTIKTQSLIKKSEKSCIKEPVTTEKSSGTEEILMEIQEITTNSRSTSLPLAKEEPSKINSRHFSKRLKATSEEVRLAVALAVVVLMFVICWLPYCFSMLLSIFVPHKVPRGYHLTTLIVGYANSGINPIIYGVMNKKFGDGFKSIFCCRCTK